MLHAPVTEKKAENGQTQRPLMPSPERERYPVSVETTGHPSPTGSGSGLTLQSAAAHYHSHAGNLQRLYGNQAVLQMRSGPGGQLPLTPLRPSQSGLLLQRKCACGGTAGMSGACAECQQKREDTLQRRAANGGKSDTVPPIVHEVLFSPGQPFDPATRAFMEPRFGHDFGNVRIHTDAHAAESAQMVSSLAYTVGRDVVFGAGQYAPETPVGRHLLAHELTHVVQQRGATVDLSIRDRLAVTRPDEMEERQADETAAAIAEPRAIGMIQYFAPKIARQESNRETLPSDATQSPNPTGSSLPGRPVFFCSKPILLSSLHGKSHAFFRVGGTGSGNSTFELEHDKSCPCAYQGWPRRDDADDFNAKNATCIPAPMITEACLISNWNTYPVGKYCAWGPNSNTYTRVIAEKCGAVGLRPPGNVPGFDDAPPVAGTGGPDPFLSALTGICPTNDCDYFSCPD